MILVSQAMLEGLWSEVASEPAGNGLCRARRISAQGAAHVFAGIRNSDGARALLIELDARLSPPLRFRFETEGLTLVRQPMGSRTLFALVVTEASASSLFGVLASDIASHVIDGPDSEAGNRLETRLSVWRSALRSRREILSRYEVLGLWGELHFLIVLAGRFAPENALKLWCGPEGGIHDFVGNSVGIECKTQSGADPALHVSSLEQLDPRGLRRLALMRLRLAEAPAGRSLADMVARARECAGGWELERKLALAGWRDTDGEIHSEPRFAIVDEVIFKVDVGFPALNRSNVPFGILEATYRVDPQPLDAFRLAEQGVDALISELGDAHG